jgi:hypothetical protein
MPGVVPGIQIDNIATTLSLCEIAINYWDYHHRIVFWAGELEKRPKEWLLDDLVTQFEKFKVTTTNYPG